MLEIKINNIPWKIYFQYGKDANKKPITMCFIENMDINKTLYGECTLYYKDKFDKSVGRKIALGRAIEKGGFSREERAEIWNAYMGKISASQPKMGADLIKDERIRQMDQEGFGVKHDDEHVNEEILQYAQFMLDPNRNPFPTGWDEKWREKVLNRTKKENLIKAGALIAAEYDRIDRIDKNREKIKAEPISDGSN